MLGEHSCDLRRVLHDGVQLIAVDDALTQCLGNLPHGTGRFLSGRAGADHVHVEQFGEFRRVTVIGHDFRCERAKTCRRLDEIVSGDADLVRVFQRRFERAHVVSGGTYRVFQHGGGSTPLVAHFDDVGRDVFDGLADRGHSGDGGGRIQILVEVEVRKSAAESIGGTPSTGTKGCEHAAERVFHAALQVEALIERAGKQFGHAQAVRREESACAGCQFGLDGGGEHRALACFDKCGMQAFQRWKYLYPCGRDAALCHLLFLSVKTQRLVDVFSVHRIEFVILLLGVLPVFRQYAFRLPALAAVGGER